MYVLLGNVGKVFNILFLNNGAENIWKNQFQRRALYDGSNERYFYADLSHE